MGTPVNLDKLSLIQLKALAYDINAVINDNRANLDLINNVIAKKTMEPTNTEADTTAPEATPEVTPEVVAETPTETATEPEVTA